MQLKHIILSVFVSAAFWGSAQAQSIDDALTFSNDEIAGSARLKGMGNVHTAIGGDISSINGNPAGLGFFSRSDISITFNALNNSNKTNFLNQNTSNNKTTFGVDQAGAVFAFPSRRNYGWQNFNVGLSYNKNNNFNNALKYNGINENSTIVNTLTDIMDGNTEFENDFYDSYLVEKFQNSSLGYFPIAKENGQKEQYNDILNSGHQSRIAMSFGANYNNSFYIGATLGISSFTYNKSTIFSEYGWTKGVDEIAKDNPTSNLIDPNHEDYDFANASYDLFDEFVQKTEGTGLDFKLGMIFKPAVDWNIGIAINTPTKYNISEDGGYFTDVFYYDNEQTQESFYDYEYKSDFYSDYKLTTPWKLSVGATKFFGGGLITADAEYVTYNTTKFSSANGSMNNGYEDMNQDIKDLYKGAFNIRVGGEYLMTDALSARAGVNFFGNPYQGGIEDKKYNGSLGLGYKLTNNLYMDLAVVHQINTYSEAPYTLSNFWLDRGRVEPIADIKHSRTSGIITIGAKF